LFRRTPPVIEYEEIVIGSSLRAVLYAFSNRYPLLFTSEQRPFRFEYLPPKMDLSFLKLDSQTKNLLTFNEEKQVGVPKELLWERLLFLLSIDSKVPLSNLATKIRKNNDNSISCFNEYSKIAEFKFDKCYYFGDNNIDGILQQKKVAEKKYICYDWIAFNRGGKHDIDYIQTEDDFVKEIWFYPSDRIDGNTSIKDACAVSYLTDKQINDFNYSETMARFKTIHEMELRGMKGKFNGYGKNGKPKHYKFRTTSIHRERSEQTNQHKAESTHIEIPLDSEKDMLQNLPTASVAFNRFLKYL
tara:strand:+ start:226 stop:1128 length:903 start_codon:yes stop_codon:yes gene_type:complete